MVTKVVTNEAVRVREFGLRLVKQKRKAALLGGARSGQPLKSGKGWGHSMPLPHMLHR
jgi:hypothetical protein